MQSLTRGRYTVRFAVTGADVERAQALRWRAFRAPAGADGRGALDMDEFDARCLHALIEHRPTGALVATFRLMVLADGGAIGQSYSARYYDLSALSSYPGSMLELGRFCLDPACGDPDVLRVAWGALARIVDSEGVGMLFGCSSFAGTDPAAHLEAFALLRERHAAPDRWVPRAIAPRVFRFDGALPGAAPGARNAILRMPPLLRTYLAMGGWTSDHAVIDEDLGTLHVFTGLEISAIPAARASALRRIAAEED